MDSRIGCAARIHCGWKLPRTARRPFPRRCRSSDHPSQSCSPPALPVKFRQQATHAHCARQRSNPLSNQFLFRRQPPPIPPMDPQATISRAVRPRGQPNTNWPTPIVFDPDDLEMMAQGNNPTLAKFRPQPAQVHVLTRQLDSAGALSESPVAIQRG